MSRTRNPALNGRLVAISAAHGAWLRSQPEQYRNGVVVRSLRRVVELEVAPTRSAERPLGDSVFVRMDDELAGRVAVYAELCGVSMNTLVRTALDLEMNG